MEFKIKIYEEKLNKLINNFKDEIAKFKGGVINTAILNNIRIDYYGTKTPINELSSISVQNGRCIVIKPYERSLSKSIIPAILKADLGLNPQNNGDVIRINIPALTEETRLQTVKQLHKCMEGYKVSIRNIRQDANTAIKNNKEISDDIKHVHQKSVQNLVDLNIKLLKEISNKKEISIIKL